ERHAHLLEIAQHLESATLLAGLRPPHAASRTAGSPAPLVLHSLPGTARAGDDAVGAVGLRRAVVEWPIHAAWPAAAAPLPAARWGDVGARLGIAGDSGVAGGAARDVRARSAGTATTWSHQGSFDWSANRTLGTRYVRARAGGGIRTAR